MGRNKIKSVLFKSGSIKPVSIILIAALLLIALLAARTPAPSTQPPANTQPASTPQQTIEIKFATWDSENAFSVPHYRWFADELSKRTNGRVKMTLFLAAALGNTPELPTNLQKGVADMAVFVPTHVPGLMPMAELMSVPMLIPTAPVMQYIGWHLISEGLMKLDGVKILEIMGHEDIVLCMADKKIATLNDFKGVVLGTNGTWGPLCAKLGASEMMLPPPEIYTSVERGVVDGGPFGLGLPVSLKMGSILKYVNTDPLGNDPWIIGMNQAKWDSLPADVQTVILDLSKEANYKLAALNYQQNQVAIDYFKAQPNIELHTFAPGEYDKLVKLAQPLVADKAKEMDAKGIQATKALQIIMSDLYSLGTVKE